MDNARVYSDRRLARNSYGRQGRRTSRNLLTRKRCASRDYALIRSGVYNLIRQLEAAGWLLRSVKGSHHIYTHPSRGGHLCVPHPKRDMGVGLVQKLQKQAGLK